jgi:hypothetical protein
MNTPRVGGASPWRIKVTVQAEPGSDEENAQSPIINRFTRTQTTTIPLKDPDASSPVKRGRGRPRKSDVGTTTKPKRAGTPIKRAARSKSRDASIGAADADTDAPPKRKRGRPKKIVQSPADEEDDIIAHVLQSNNERSSEATPMLTAQPKPQTSQKSTRFATPQVSATDGQATDAEPQQPLSVFLEEQMQDDSHHVGPADRRRRKRTAEYELPVVDTPPQTELGQQLRARKGTPHARKTVSVTLSSDEESDQDSDVMTPTSGEDDAGSNESMEDPFNAGPVQGVVNECSDRSVPIIQEELCLDQQFGDEEELQDITNFAFDEGATRMPDDTTVIDSENFSMISVDSLPSSGGLTSPPKPDESHVAAPGIASLLRHEYLQPSMGNVPSSQSQDSPKSSSHPSSGLVPSEGSSRPAFRRYKTPVVDVAVPTAPPVVEPVQPVLPKNETPRLGRVVTAGVALQGVLDPSRLTPEPSQKMLDEKRDRLDDLFRGFSEGTRRELQAGLRLGEQLAQGQQKEQPPRDDPSPSKSQAGAGEQAKGNFLKTHRKHRDSRLLTPEDQDDFVITPAPESELQDVQYPSLSAPTEMSLPSPVGSDDEMSWRVDTPPTATGNTERLRNVNIEDQVDVTQKSATVNNKAPVSENTQQEDYSDIWQEEASRSSNSAEAEVAPQVQDLFEPGPVAPARGKLPRTWRRKSGNHFQYSDEAESPQQPTPDRAVPGEEDVVADVNNDEEDTASDATDDTGMFFQSNMPSIFSHRHSRDLKQRKADKLDLTLLMNEGDSLVPESSPPVVTKKSSSGTNANPFLNTPPRFPGFPSSPHKSSPLRRELRSSDLSSEAQSQFHDESSLPLAQSSPFHTYVDGESGLSVASDQRQLQMEMEGATDSSICRVRKEADEYLDAYEPQERSLDGIEEVTEHSRTWHRNTSTVASSPPRMKMLSPVRKRVALFRDTPEKPRATSKPATVEVLQNNKVEKEDLPASTPTQQPSFVDASPETQSQQRPTGLLTRMTSSLWSAVSRPAVVVPTTPSPAPHPILAKLTPLPKIEPWTKTHYKTLDKLYSVNQKHPALFSPSITPATPLSQTNTHLLNKFRANNKQPYIGAIFSAWGYEFDMTEELVVLCQVFCELMSLDSIEAYETLKGREIEMGDCIPGRTGDAIETDEVMRRLATVILGEEVREDERAGVKIDRTRSLEIQWPQ